jgi:uncharacterized protein with PQ loop repeat
MNFPSILGLIGTLLGLFRPAPQLVRLLRARESSGVSVDTAASSCIVSFGWAIYGVLTGQPFVSLATGASGLIFAMITITALRYGRRVSELKIAPGWFVVLLLSGLVFGKNGLGFVLPVSVLVSNMPQINVAYREGTLKGLSLGTWLLSMSDGLVWGTYALLLHDISIMVYGIFQLTTSGLIVAFKLARQANKKVSKKRMPAG